MFFCMSAKTTHTIQNVESIPSLSWWEQSCVYFVSCVCFPLFWRPYSSGLSSCFSYLFLLFCLSYCTAISTFWVTELIVPAHAFSADSIIRHSGHPEKKWGWEKRDVSWKCGRVKNEKVKKRKGGSRRSQIREGKVERGEEKKKGGWELRSRSRRDKLERGVRAVPWVIYLCKGKISSLECTL